MVSSGVSSEYNRLELLEQPLTEILSSPCVVLWSSFTAPQKVRQEKQERVRRVLTGVLDYSGQGASAHDDVRGYRERIEETHSSLPEGRNRRGEHDRSVLLMTSADKPLT